MKKLEIFESNPDLKEVHMTSDGQAFFKEGDAKNHAKTLENKSVEIIVNPSNYEEFLEDFEEVTGDILNQEAENEFTDTDTDSINDDDDENDDNHDDLTDLDDDSKDQIADFSGAKIGEAINPPLFGISAQADGSVNILEDTQNVINASSELVVNVVEKTESISAVENTEEKKSNPKKGK